jgi:dual-specificity kinase
VPWRPGTGRRCETHSLPPNKHPPPLALPPLRHPPASSCLPLPPSSSRRHRQQHLVGEGKNMSTPTTVAATSLPSHYNIHYSHPHYSSPHLLPCHPTNPSPYSRPPYQVLPTAPAPPANAPASAPAPAPRLPLPSPTTYSSSSSHSGLNGPAHSHSATSTRHSLRESTTLAPLITNNIASTTHREHAMPTAPAPSRAPPPSGGKRKRAPDWDDFYKNGLPQEIIVIDDTPEPSRRPASVSSQALTAGHTHEVDTSASENGHAAKRQKRHNDREPAPYDPVYHSIASSHARTSGQLASPSKSTVSSDRTNSAIHTTAATSLGSLSSSNGTYDYETQAGPKRRRTTRQQAANDAKRLEELRRDAFQAYEPPPFPPKKAAEVPVKVITDVSPLPPPPLPPRFANPRS